MTPDRMHPQAVLDRLHQLSRLADLDPDRRLDFKVDYSPAAIHRRLRRQSMLRTACRTIEDLGSKLRTGGRRFTREETNERR